MVGFFTKKLPVKYVLTKVFIYRSDISFTDQQIAVKLGEGVWNRGQQDRLLGSTFGRHLQYRRPGRHHWYQIKLYNSEPSLDILPSIRVKFFRVLVTSNNHICIYGPSSSSFYRVLVGPITHLIQCGCLEMSSAELIEEDKLRVCGDVLIDLTHVVPRTTIFCIKGLKERGLTAVRFGRPNPVVALLAIQ